ncbi:hypothetical protein OCL06_16000 [Alteromonas sp. ASW11-19]|uniref:Secreted protein n=1 Tax=Alteromonas salexigens TaxID=2982530 RepID=A0ABT2VSH6_9ALTE|nr:hypothetical protein [Alteromonas salexigens]MCU7556095.1 hypothetical protein [Alteromonas salexigens]
MKTPFTQICSTIISASAILLTATAHAQTMSIDECAVHQRTEMRDRCLGTNTYGDPARDPTVVFYNRCDVKIGVKVCFSYPDGTKKAATEYIESGETEEVYACTKPGSNRRQQPSPSNYFVWNSEETSGYKYKC